MTQQWKPIESAPKDGTEIWAYNGEQARMGWIEGQGYALWVWADPLLSDADPNPEQPTHWMPLPAAPSKYTGDHDGMQDDPRTRWQQLTTPPSSAQPERDWELDCDHCNGSGHVFVKHQVAELKTDVQEFQEDCECCEGRGFTIAFEDIPGIAEYVKSCRPAPATTQDAPITVSPRSRCWRCAAAGPQH